VAHQIEREDGLINTRITWMLTFEGFLFAALALVADDQKVDTAVYGVLKYALPGVGIAVGLLAGLAVLAALMALSVLKGRWKPEEAVPTGIHQIANMSPEFFFGRGREIPFQ